LLSIADEQPYVTGWQNRTILFIHTKVEQHNTNVKRHHSTDDIPNTGEEMLTINCGANNKLMASAMCSAHVGGVRLIYAMLSLN